MDTNTQKRNARETTALDIEGQRPKELLYSVEDVPPWYLCILLGFQHYLTAFGAIVSVPLILAPAFCVAGDNVGLSQLIGTIFFCSGLATLLQTTLGIRLPIIQGGSFTFLTPTFAILAQHKPICPYTEAEQGKRNLSDLPAVGSDAHQDIWHARLREIQGAIMVASVFQVVIGYSGLMGAILRFIGPLAVTPTVSLIGLALFPEAAALASKQWYIAITCIWCFVDPINKILTYAKRRTVSKVAGSIKDHIIETKDVDLLIEEVQYHFASTIVLIAIFSQYLRNIHIPVCRYKRGEGCESYKLPLFKLFPVMMAMIIAWILCAILTAAGAFPDDPAGWGYAARTDIKTSALTDSAWFRFPYPGQWGVPTVSTAAVFGMLAGVLTSMIESVGDYYACARLSGAPPPPDHAITRGIGIEGVACILAGAWGSGSGTTSYSENIGAIGITKVGSRRVVQVGALIMIILGCLGKFGGLFVTIPDPVIGGMFLVTFGMVAAVGLSNLQFVDLNSSRNIFVLGLSLFFGLAFPVWMKDHASNINTGNAIVDQILAVLLGTSMFVGGLIGFVLDNTIPGTDEERGIVKWRSIVLQGKNVHHDIAKSTVYEIPFIQKFLNLWKWPTFLPFCPTFDPNRCCRCCSISVDEDNATENATDIGISTEEKQSGAYWNKGLEYEPSTNDRGTFEGTDL